MAISGLIEKKNLEALEFQEDPKVPTERFQRNFLPRTMLGIDFLKQIGRWYFHDQETINYAKSLIKEFMKEKKNAIGRKNLTIHTFRFKPEEGNFILSKIDTYWFLDEIIDFYKASVYPTPATIQRFFQTKYPGRQKIFGGEFPRIAYEIEQALSSGDILDPNSKLSNTYLMKHFPGIHYNVICRETHPQCIVSIQRSTSQQQDAAHYEETNMTIEPTNEELKPFLQSIQDVQKGRYRSFTQKKQRIRNKLLNKADLLTRMTNNQRQKILNTLKANRIVNEQNNATQKPISKTIKHILFPKRYPITKGGTRKIFSINK